MVDAASPEEDVGLADAALEDDAAIAAWVVGTTEDDEVSAAIAFCCATNVVEEAGQPTPVPLRFCRVTSAALMRASWDAVELSEGKVS